MKQKLKIIIDILMVGLVLGCSGYQFFSQALHEWLGAIALLTFIIHNILNRSWYRHLLKGHYTSIRCVYIIVNSLVVFTMLMQMISGIMMSRVVFDFLNMHYLISLARRMHILGAYWGFLLIGLHIGLHWHMCIRYYQKKVSHLMIPIPHFSFVLSALIAIYGFYAMIKRNFFTYLFLRNEFVFMDFQEPLLFFYLDYFMIIGLCIFISYYGIKLLRQVKGI